MVRSGQAADVPHSTVKHTLRPSELVHNVLLWIHSCNGCAWRGIVAPQVDDTAYRCTNWAQDFVSAMVETNNIPSYSILLGGEHECNARGDQQLLIYCCGQVDVHISNI